MEDGEGVAERFTRIVSADDPFIQLVSLDDLLVLHGES